MYLVTFHRFKFCDAQVTFYFEELGADVRLFYDEMKVQRNASWAL